MPLHRPERCPWTRNTVHLRHTPVPDRLLLCATQCRETQKLIRIQSGHARQQTALVNLINCQSPRSKRIQWTPFPRKTTSVSIWPQAMAKHRKNVYAAALARSRWARIPKAERSRYVPRTGGRPRKYPRCRRYGSHRFSPTTDRCPCGYIRPKSPATKR